MPLFVSFCLMQHHPTGRGINVWYIDLRGVSRTNEKNCILLRRSLRQPCPHRPAHPLSRSSPPPLFACLHVVWVPYQAGFGFISYFCVCLGCICDALCLIGVRLGSFGSFGFVWVKRRTPRWDSRRLLLMCKFFPIENFRRFIVKIVVMSMEIKSLSTRNGL